MADLLTFDLVSPERRLATASARMVQIPGMMGEFTAMPGHAAFFSTLRPGVVTVHAEGETRRYFVTGGFAEITAGAASVLAEEAVERELLTRDFVEQKLREAEAALAAAPEGARTAAAQRVADFRAAIGQLGL
jgi:F-type H+-transporting ATPase subunit epsilon